MEVKIGVQHAPRELVLESAADSAEEIIETVTEALTSKKSLVTFEDDRGRRVIVPVDKLAYVELGEPVARGVGFTAA
ncbi:MAG TPA: DUF3107 domain-containing protein [Candidatus Stackebrandtia excrementipullorum]|nr:DUF3107 domain-containing protein [Candidatus Stackebrandtia excrementipullorum]